ncbi:hypothetical protein OCA05_23775 [Bacillus cereus]|uniref:hypothetical protein n=2 Tax=Bacillus cereus TaxID=1396 RepID=UPI001145EF7D|nr:hypothetical protein [Bacillus cereus]MCU5242572.1 hypothetical protein [Bacillus cereus]HDX9683702.1 hypothetical protein [Bacillus cereus]HDX9684480.1 hypothetical protein [Bacillus cereus]
MYRQYCYKVPYTYAQCMADCTPGAPGFEYECRPICWQYKTRPWYLQCTRPTAYTTYGMNQVVPYNPQPSYSSYSYPETMYVDSHSTHSPSNDPCMKECAKGGSSPLDCCYYCGWC